MRTLTIHRAWRLSGMLSAAMALILVMPLTLLAASAPQDFYAGKRMTILIGFPPAGGHDLEARIMARHLPRHIPRLSSVVVQNMPGAGGLMMGAYMYKRANPDGLTTAVFGGTHLQSAILGEGVEYDVTKMNVSGR